VTTTIDTPQNDTEAWKVVIEESNQQMSNGGCIVNLIPKTLWKDVTYPKTTNTQMITIATTKDDETQKEDDTDQLTRWIIHLLQQQPQQHNNDTTTNHKYTYPKDCLQDETFYDF